MNSPNTSHDKSFSNIRIIRSLIFTALKGLYVVGGLLIMTAVYSDESSELTENQLITPGVDARFPNSNPSKHCRQNYEDYYRCIKAKGEDYPPCTQFKKNFASLCPAGWVKKWDEERENGTYHNQEQP